MRRFRTLYLGVLTALGMFLGCKSPQPACEAVPLVDSVGAADESDRREIQWLRITGKLDSAQRDPAVWKRLERSVHSLDSSADRYERLMATPAGEFGSGSGCVDWSATWRGDRVDRQGLLTAWLRGLVASRVVALEWTESDTASDSTRVGVIYQSPGPDGGSLDSLRLEIGRRTVRRLP